MDRSNRKEMIKRYRFLLWCAFTLGVIGLTTLLFYDSPSTKKVTALHSSLQQILHQIHYNNRTSELPEHPEQPGVVKHTYAFLKVHKAASTTTQAIFLRYGWNRNLTFILPPEYNRFGYPNIISTNESLTIYNTLPPPGNKTYDILCHHVIYGLEEWNKFFPNNNTLTAGTVREPWSLFKSILNYFNPTVIRIIPAEDQLGEFLKDPEKYNKGSVRPSYLNNRLSFEYGVDPDIIRKRDTDAFNHYLHNVLDKVFDVVIVAEMYDESLIIMKRVFNWSLNDIMYAKKNVRSSEKSDRYEIKEGFVELYKQYAIFDYMLYDYFLKRLQRQIAEQGDSFKRELKHFKDTRTYVENFCHNVPMMIKSVVVSKSEWNDEFEITREDCQVLHAWEITFTQDIRRRQYGNATWTWGGHNRPPK